MKKTERNRLYMLQSVLKVVDTHKEAWQNMPEFTAGFGILEGYEGKIRGLFQQKQLLLQPYAGIKSELRQDFALVLGKLGAYLRLVARQKKEANLILVTDYTVASLERMNAQKCLALSENVVHYAQLYESELGAFENATQLLAKAKLQIGLFKEKGLIPSERRRLLGETTHQIAVQGRALMDYLKKELDFLMRFFIDTAPVFYSAYQNARIIPKLKGNGSHRQRSEEESDASEAGSANGNDSFAAYEESSEGQIGGKASGSESGSSSQGDE